MLNPIEKLACVIVPVYNEASSISKALAQILARPEVGEILIIDDGSTDGTLEILKAVVSSDPRMRLFSHAVNEGKGAAIRTAISHVQKPFVIIQDADLEYNPDEYPAMLRPLIEDQADAVYGSRFLGGQPHRVLYFWHRIANAFLTLFSNMFTNLNLTDMETGFKAFRREILQKVTIQENRFGFEPEITLKLSHLAARFYEVGISYRGRTYAEGKKINWKDGISAVRCILKYSLVR